MTEKEKALAYDKAIEKIRTMHRAWSNLESTYPAKDVVTELEYYFPELNESEDERIRKSLITTITNMNDSVVSCNYGFKKNKILAWLEKQGEQKPADKVEPKFKVGDFIKHNKANIICKVISVNSGSYYVENIETGGRIELFNAEQNFHLWTIKDAKDGDVLVYNNTSTEIILLFKKWMNGVGEGAYSYAHTFDNKILFDDWSDCGKNAHPATKEQRDLLFQKMKEAGYEWDSDKKELKKIVEKPIKWVRDIKEEIIQYLDAQDMLSGGTDNDFKEWIAWLEKQKEPMTVEKCGDWSDDRYMSILQELHFLKSLDEYEQYINEEDITKNIEWLASLKERMEEQQ